MKSLLNFNGGRDDQDLFCQFGETIASLLALSLVPAKSVLAHVAILHPGDEIGGMTLTNGSGEARPLWIFCSSEVSKNVTIANCRVPQTYRLAIGHAFLGTDEVFGKSG